MYWIHFFEEYISRQLGIDSVAYLLVIIHIGVWSEKEKEWKNKMQNAPFKGKKEYSRI